MPYYRSATSDGSTTGRFSCAKYRRYGGKECSRHNVSLSDLNAIVLEDIRRNASLAAADWERYVDYLVSLSSREWDGERASWTKEAELFRYRRVCLISKVYVPRLRNQDF